MKKREENKNKNENEIEIVIGDGTALDISEVNDCMNSLRPKTLGGKKKNVIIPSVKKKTEKSNKTENDE